METIIEIVNNNQIFQGGMILAAMSWLFYSLKSVPIVLMRKVQSICTYEIYFDSRGDFYYEFAEWFRENYPNKIKNVEVGFKQDKRDTYGSPTDETDDKLSLYSHQRLDYNIIFFQGRFLWISKTREKLESARDIRSMFLETYVVRGLFAKNQLQLLCAEIKQAKQERLRTSGLVVHTADRHGHFNRRVLKYNKTLDNIFHPAVNEIKTDLDSFISRSQIYKEIGINYKRGYLFYGPPGTGKSSLALAIANYTGYQIYTINLSDENFRLDLMAHISGRAVILFEDIDCVLTGREVKNDHIDFASVLNMFDGVYAPSDCIIILTANSIKNLDPALLRSGRIDMKVELGYPNTDSINDLFEYVFKKPLKLEKAQTNIPMSQIQDICINHEREYAESKIYDLIRSNRTED